MYESKYLILQDKRFTRLCLLNFFYYNIIFIQSNDNRNEQTH